MKVTHTKLLAGLMAALVVFTGAAAALPGNAPDGAPADGDEPADDRQGPPSDLPGPVPDFVESLLDRIADFLAADLDGSLGPQISDLTPGGDG